MTRTKTQHSSHVLPLEPSRSSLPRLLGASVILLPLLWGTSSCSSSEDDPNGENDPSTTSGETSTNSATSGVPSTGGTTDGSTNSAGTTGGGTTTEGMSTSGGNGAGTDTDGTDTEGTDTDTDTEGTDTEGTDTDTDTDTDTEGTDTDTEAESTSMTDADGGGSDGVDAGTGDDDTGGASDDPLSPGCGTAFQNPPPDGEQQTLEIDGTTRYYLMDVPDNADNETPLMLVFALHGFDMNNIAVVDLFNFTERSAGQAITVWPQGEGPHPGNMSHWGDQVLRSTWSPNEQNYAFLRQIMTDLGERYCIDQERIFIAGFSMGGFFTNQIACDHGDWFRGFAPVAGGGPQACANADMQSAIMVQHGTADDIVELSSGEGSRDFWLEQNGCGTSVSSSLNNCEFYDGCADGKPVAWCTGGYDHYIPDEVASNIWSFFSDL